MRVVIIGLAMILGVFVGWTVSALLAFFVIIGIGGEPAFDLAYSTAIFLGIIGAACVTGLARWVVARATRRSA
jgi:hypothetical protein